MTLFLVVLLLFSGMILLLLGGHFLVEASISLAERLGMSEFLIGLTVLTIGTSIPELFVSVAGGLEQVATSEPVGNLIIGQILGSAIGNIGLVLGVAGAIGYLTIQKKQLTFQSFFLVGSVFLLWVFSMDRIFTRGEAITMIFLYGLYLVMLSLVLPRRKVKAVKHKFPLPIALGQLFLGLVMLTAGSHLVVDNGLQLAEVTRLSQSLVGILIIGLGTSLPELVVTITASARRARELSVGNIIGSNIFDVMVALPAGALIANFKFEPALVRFDIPFLVFISIITMLFFVSRKQLQSRESWLLIGLYAAYVSFKVLAVI